MLRPVGEPRGTICANPDNGFVTITNSTGSPFSGTISLTGNSLTGGDPFCPVGGAASDSTGGLAAGASVTLALGSQGTTDTPKGADSSNCGGFNYAQTLTLTANQESKASFGKDDYKITPLNSAAGAKLDVLPVPVPAGPTGTETNPTASSLTFSPGPNYSNLKCIPYADFSATNNPVCVELQLTPNDGGNYLYTATNDFNIDAHSLPNGVGGPSFLGHHGVSCPDSGFDTDIFFTYTAPSATFGDPLKGGGSGTGSCWVAAFDPTVAPVAAGGTVATFSGLQSPVQKPPKFTLVNAGAAVPLTWQQLTSSGSPVTTLSLCTTVGNPDGTCTGGASQPWVSIGTIQINCTTEVPLTGAFEVSAAGGSSLQNLGGGSYRFSLKTLKSQAGTCEVVVFQFNGGSFVFPADIKIK